jgi:hypothetical protein
MRAPIVLLAASLALGAQDAFPKPTPHHLAMKSLAGTWDAEVKYWVDTAKPPMVSKGVEVNRVVLGGLWLESEFKSEMMGAPFEGRGLFGYDPALGKHVGTWVDNMGTAQSISAGTCKDGCKEVTSFFMGPDMEGKTVTYKEVNLEQDADHRTMTMYNERPGGAYVKNMEIAYTRRK